MMKEKNPNVLLCTVPQRIGNRANSNSNNVNFPPPLAILSLFDWMDKFGYSGDFYDIHLLLPSNDEIYNHITSVAPDVVGLSAVVGQAYKQTKLISSIVRSASPDALIIVGGNMALSANVLLKKTDIDVCALGDGENTLIEIIKYRKKYGNSIITKELLKIKGIAFLNEDGEMEFTGWGVNNSNKDNQFPDYELLSKGLLDHPELIDHYFGDGKKNNLFQSNPKAYEPNRKPRMAHVTTSKGCVATCSFCKQLTKLRAFDLTPFEDHLIELKNKYDVQFVQVLDENFGGLKQHSLEVARILHKHDFLWKSGWRVNSFTLEEVKFLTECGWTDIDATIETFSSKILKIMDKRITVEEIRTAIKNYADCGVLSTLSPPHADMLIGNPGETDETIIESGRHLGKVACELDFPLPITDPRWVVTTPGTHMFAYAQLIGVVGTEVDDVEEFLLFISDKSASWEAFVNLTGESIKTVEFWPYLLQFACTRAYYDNMKKKMKNKGESVVKRNRNFIRFPIIRKII